jgi:hypothetical protein
MRPGVRTNVWVRRAAVLAIGIAAAAMAPLALGSHSSRDASASEIQLQPFTATHAVGHPNAITAFLAVGDDPNNPNDERGGMPVTFTVLDGPNAGLTATVVADFNGRADWSYTGTITGTDHIQAYFDDNDDNPPEGIQYSNVISDTWVQAVTAQAVPTRDVPLVQEPTSTTFQPLLPGQALVPGTKVDVSGHSGVLVEKQRGPKMFLFGVPDGVPSLFQITAEAGKGAGPVNLKLVGGKFALCKKNPRTFASFAAGAKEKTPKPVRRLWGSGKGRYTTSGKYASATIRGTFYLVADYCDGTLIYVREGSVRVHDLVKKKYVIVKTGHYYFAQAPGK